MTDRLTDRLSGCLIGLGLSARDSSEQPMSTASRDETMSRFAVEELPLATRTRLRQQPAH